MTDAQDKQQAIKDEAAAEKAFQATQTADDKAAAERNAKVAKAQKNIDDKQDILTKANEAAVKAHNDLMTAHKEATQV